MLIARIRGTREELRALAELPLRIHRSGVRKIGDGRFEVPAILEVPEAALLELKGYEIVLEGDVGELLMERLQPRSARSQTPDSADSFFYSLERNNRYLEVDYIENWIGNLPGLFPSLCSVVELPNKTWEGRTSSAIQLRVGNGRYDRPSVLFTSGVHAAELGGPDSCIYFLYRLIQAYMKQAPITLGYKTYAVNRVRAILEGLDIFVFPCVNPDGRAYVQTSYGWWRKNRNPNVGMNSIGVDINRNFDFLWSSGIGSSFVPVDDTYKGPRAFSEPETRNVQWLLDRSSADFFLDIHGPSGVLLYLWGDAADQSFDASMSFLNPAWEGRRNSRSYGEYVNGIDAAFVRQLGGRMIGAANAVGDGEYQSHQSFEDLYPTTATSDDYAYSRHLAAPGQFKTYGFTLEYGGGDFFPPYDAMETIIDEVNAVMLELCDAVANRPSTRTR